MSYVFAAGSGTPESPYQVWDAADLDGVRDHLDSHFIQMADIDLSGIPNWSPIGPSFKGHYDGGLHHVSGMTIESDEDYLGLFAVVESGSIENLTLVGPRITVLPTGEPQTCYGALAGLVVTDALKAAPPKLVIRNCHVRGGDVNGGHGLTSYVGGLCGVVAAFLDVDDQPTEVLFSQCTVRDTSVWGNYTVGAAVGYLVCFETAHLETSRITVQQCAVDAIQSQAGGLAGAVHATMAGRSLVYGCSVQDTTVFVGAFLGGGFAGAWDGYPFARDSYVRGGSVSAGGLVSGFAGVVGARGGGDLLRNCYCAIPVTMRGTGGLGDEFCAGFALAWEDVWNPGPPPSTAFNCYFDDDVFGIAEVGDPSYIPIGDARTTAQMTYPYEEATTYVDWDFEEIWTIAAAVNEGYPTFRTAAGPVTASRLAYTTDTRKLWMAIEGEWQKVGSPTHTQLDDIGTLSHPELDQHVTGVANNAHYVACTAGPGGVNAYQVVYLAPAGTVLPADGNNASHAGRVIGVALNAGLESAGVRVQRGGQVTNTAWALSPGKVYYLVSGGELSDAPGTGFLQRVGVAVSANTLALAFGEPTILS